MHRPTPICIKINPRENRFFAAGEPLVSGKGTHNVKILAQNQTKKIITYTRA